MTDLWQSNLQQHSQLVECMRADAVLSKSIREAAALLLSAVRRDANLFVVGNGGSAADAQHFACELAGRHRLNRRAVRAEYLFGNASLLTALANDFSYDGALVRILESRGRAGDVLIALSTSGNSGNILRAVAKAREWDMQVVGLTGESGGKLAELCSVSLRVPSADTPRIQEGHILIAHALLEMIERDLTEGQ